MCTHKKINKCRCYQCLCTGGGSLLNVKMSDQKNMYITILLFTGTLRLSLNTEMFYLNIYEKHEMVWILLLVHITLHGMIGGLLKHFPKAVWGNYLFFIYKNSFECQKESCFLSLSRCIRHQNTHHERSFNLRWESGRICCQRAAISFFFHLKSARDCRVARSQSNTNRDAIFTPIPQSLRL